MVCFGPSPGKMPGGPAARGSRRRGSRRRGSKSRELFAWLGNFRRLVVRCERQAENYLGFVRLGCVMILLRHS